MLTVPVLLLGGLFGPGGFDSNNSPLAYILWFAPIIVLMIYGQKFQAWMVLGDVSKSLTRSKTMKETARTEAIDYIKTSITPAADPSERIDKFLEYFAIMPIDLDPQGIIRKLDHVMRTKDETNTIGNQEDGGRYDRMACFMHRENFWRPPPL